MLVINSIYYYFRITLLSIESLIALYTTKKSILYYYTDPTVYENSCMMYISLIEALLTKYEGAEVYRALLQYWLLGHWMNRLDEGSTPSCSTLEIMIIQYAHACFNTLL